MHFRHSTSQKTLLFLFLLGLLLRCHRHLLLGFPGVGISATERDLPLRRRDYILKTLPHFVGIQIITTLLIVCQEKNIIL